jgi:glycosyltransferase involved in cell wall biosynthesis
MKVMHLNDVANVGAELTKGLRSMGVEAEIYSLNFPMARGESERTFLKIFAVPYMLKQLISFNKHVRQTAPDIVHIHAAYLGLAGLMGRYPYILHCHGWDLYMNLYRPMLRALTIKCLKGAARVLYSTPNLKHYLDEIGVSGVFLPNPTDVKMFSPPAEKRLPGRKVFIHSRIETIKGIDVVFDVLRKMAKLDPSLHFYCVNSGNRVNECRGFANLTLLDAVDHCQVPKLINQCDLILGQFYLGVMGMAELEAMSCCKPVIIYFNRNDAYLNPPPLFSSKDPDEIVDLIRGLIDDPGKCEEIGKTGRRWVMANHGLSEVTERLMGIYNSVIDERS